MAEFATCSQDSLVLWDYKSFVSKNSARPFSGAGYHIQSAGWSASNNKLMVAPKWGDCVAWCEPTVSTTEWNTVWHKDRGHFTCGCFLSNSRYLLSGSSDGLLMIWDLKNKTTTKQIDGHSSPVTALTVSSVDQLIFSSGQDGKLLLHSLSPSHSVQNTITLSSKETEEQGVVTRLKFSVTNRSMAASATDRGCVALWSAESQRMLHRFSSPESSPATDLAFAQSNNKLLVSVGQDRNIRFLDVHQRKEVMLVSTPSPLSSVAVLRDGHTVAAGGINGKVYVYELRAMKTPKHVLEAHEGAVTSIAEQNSVKSPRTSLRKSSSKKTARDITGLIPSDSPAITLESTTSVTPHNYTTQLAPTSSSSSSSSSFSLPAPTYGEGHTNQPQPGLPLASHLHPPPPPTAPHLTGGGGVPHTPFSVRPSPGDHMQWSQFTTPALTASDKDSSTGIFSPLESTTHSALYPPPPPPPPTVTETAASNGVKFVAPPVHHHHHTQRTGTGGGSSRPTDTREQYPLMSTFVSSTPAMKHPPLGMSAIFSPLDATAAAPPASSTPALVEKVSLQGVDRGQGAPGSEAAGLGLRQSPLVTPSASTPPSSTVESHQLAPNYVAESVALANQSSLPPPQPSHALPPATPRSPHASSSSSQISVDSGASPPVPGGQDHKVPHPTAGAYSETDGTTNGALASLEPNPAAPSGYRADVKYLETAVRDAAEELRLGIHQDIRALSLDMFREFLILKQQVGSIQATMSSLDERVSRLANETRHLQEQFDQQYSPKY